MVEPVTVDLHVMVNPSIPPKARILYAQLQHFFFFTNRAPEHWPGVDNLCFELGIARVTFWKYLGILEAQAAIPSLHTKAIRWYEKTWQHEERKRLRRAGDVA